MIRIRRMNDAIGRRVRIKEGLSPKGRPVKVISVVPGEGLLIHDMATAWLRKYTRQWKALDFYRFRSEIPVFGWQPCGNCEGTGTITRGYDGKLQTCGTCMGDRKVNRSADRIFPAGVGEPAARSGNRICEECSEVFSSDRSRICGPCRRALWADKTDWEVKDGMLHPPISEEDQVERECDCGRGSRIHWLDAQRVCQACWTEAYQPQLTNPIFELAEPDEADHVINCDLHDCDLCDEIVAA